MNHKTFILARERTEDGRAALGSDRPRYRTFFAAPRPQSVPAEAITGVRTFSPPHPRTLMQTEEESPASPGDMSDARPVMKRGADSALDIELEGIMGRLGNLQHSDANEQITKFVEVIGCSHDEAKASPFAPPGLD